MQIENVKIHTSITVKETFNLSLSIYRWAVSKSKSNPSESVNHDLSLIDFGLPSKTNRFPLKSFTNSTLYLNLLASF